MRQLVNRGHLLLLVILIAAGAFRIAATYKVFSQTHDEPAHIACGMEWLSRGTYNYEPQHPPLARAASAFGLWLKGLRSIGHSDMYEEGNALLYSGDDLLNNLFAARVGILPFFVLCAVAVYLWARRLFGVPAALASVFLVVNLPPLLGHAGLATTDMAVTATFTAALFLFTEWLDRPSALTSACAGAALALMLLSKFSCILFFPAAGAVTLALRYWGRRTAASPTPGIRRKAVVILLLVALLVTWAAYRFSFDRITEAKGFQILRDGIGDSTPLRRAAQAVLRAPMPAGKLVWGIGSAVRHGRLGHGSYLLGEVRSHGWWYFFPVVLAVKTPLPFLLLALLGIGLSVRAFVPQRGWRPLVPAASALAILLVSLPSTINLGVRHILPMFPLLAIAGGYAVVRLWEARIFPPACRVLAVCLLLWLAVESLAAHPDYLAYFNQVAGKRPERILVESDLDWGQDLNRLQLVLADLKAPRFSYAIFGTADFQRHHLPPAEELLPGRPVTGWVAVSQHYLQIHPGDYAWLAPYPSRPVGKSIRLYWVPEAAAALAASPALRPRGPQRQGLLAGTAP